ncbi:MAG: hypothetical protein DRO08_04145 [Thermoprotei archaeon]|nr:MAG: hypothetical protein DRO08_04145 [Thermoprotei archaeon]
MKLDIKEYIKQQLLLICKDQELSSRDTKRVTEENLVEIVYMVENRLESAIYEMFEEVMDD